MLGLIAMLVFSTGLILGVGGFLTVAAMQLVKYNSPVWHDWAAIIVPNFFITFPLGVLIFSTIPYGEF